MLYERSRNSLCPTAQEFRKVSLGLDQKLLYLLIFLGFISSLFYLFKFKPDTITGPPVYTPNDETDYSIIKSNQRIPFSVKLPGADQGVIYDRMYFHHTEVIDGTVFTFKRLNEI